MSRVARRISIAPIRALATPPSETGVLVEQRSLDTALRGKTARRVRATLRRMEPVVVLAPRWGATTQFLEDLALDLAVGEPAIGCRTVSFRPIKGRSLTEAWLFTLHIFGQLGHRGWRPSALPTVVDRRGFRWALDQLLEEAHKTSRHRVALLAHEAEHLPMEIVEDIGAVWTEYLDRHPEARRCAILLSGTASERWLTLGGAPRIELTDYGEEEAVAAIVGRAGPIPVRQAELAARFSGGIPGLVESFGKQGRALGRLPVKREELMASLGPLADEMRGAVDIVAAHDELSDRLSLLLHGEPVAADEQLDTPLVLAGLARRVRGTEGAQVMLRAPAIAALVG